MPSELLSYRLRIGKSELTKPAQLRSNPTPVSPKPAEQLKKQFWDGTCSWRPAYLPSRAICPQAKKSGRGRLFRQLLFLGSGTLSSSTPLLQSSRRAPWRIGFWRVERTYDDLRHPRPRRSFLWRQYSSGAISKRPFRRAAGCD